MSNPTKQKIGFSGRSICFIEQTSKREFFSITNCEIQFKLTLWGKLYTDLLSKILFYNSLITFLPSKAIHIQSLMIIWKQQFYFIFMVQNRLVT